MGIFGFIFKRNKKNDKKENAKQNSTAVADIVELKTPEISLEKQRKTSTPTKESVSERNNSETGKIQTNSEAENKDYVIDEAVDEGKITSPSERNGYFDIKKTKDDRYTFNLFASNHIIIASSQVYSSPSAALTGVKSVMANADKASIEDQTQKDAPTLPYPKWEIYLDSAKKYRFRLSASNGSCICHSQGYTKKSSCKKGIESIIKFAKKAEIKKSYLKK